MELKNSIYVLITIIATLMLVVSCSPVEEITDDPIDTEDPVDPEITDDIEDEDSSSISAIAVEIQYTDDGTAYLVNPDDIFSGGPTKGGIGVDRGIPALSDENIHFVDVFEADEWIDEDELVLALHYKGEKRVYPLQILVWHEIANDVVAGIPLAITYCPLCGSGIAYERTLTIDGESVVAEFGTSGKLYNSNLVMYDDLTDTYWQQIDGKAIVGDLVGQELTDISIDTVVWRDYKLAHTDAEVLSQDTGMDRNYGNDPYGSYYESSLLFFPVDNEDDSIHPKTVTFGVYVEGVYKAYLEDDLILDNSITDTIGSTTLTIERDSVGLVSITDQDGNEVVKERDFFFAWYAFHPETLVYGR
ncbi:DUF3179 domain-containing protein [archaeon]|jgi:hypothetical protein|nr:DUF3179 domain-containing protein [archaeon]MBT6762331.1 DUF3179 domain-containing protein [archaeon]